MGVLRKIACLFFCFHVLAIAAANFPRATALTPFLLAPFTPYMTWTGQWQSWDMFDTIPYDSEFTVKAYATDIAGKKTEYGAVLPTLQSPDQFPNGLRFRAFFYRIYPGSRANEQYWLTYAKRLCAAVQADSKANGKPAIDSVSLDFVSERLNGLPEIRQYGKIARPYTATRGPVKCL